MLKSETSIRHARSYTQTTSTVPPTACTLLKFDSGTAAQAVARAILTDTLQEICKGYYKRCIRGILRSLHQKGSIRATMGNLR